MQNLTQFLSAFLFILLSSLSVSTRAQNDDLKTVVYTTPPAFQASMVEGSFEGDPFAPEPSEKVLLSAQDVIERAGILVPQGGDVHYVAEKNSVSLTTDAKNHELMQVFIASLVDQAESTIDLRFEVYSLPQLDAIELIDSIGLSVDASKVVKQLRDEVRENKTNDQGTKLLAAPSLSSRSGERSKVLAGKVYNYVSGYEVKDGKELPTKKTAESGTVLEVDPVIGVDSVTLDVNLSFSHSLDDMQIREHQIVGPVSGKELNYESVIEDKASLITATTLLDGQTKFVGAVNGDEKDGRILLLFLKADIRKAIHMEK